MKLVPFIKFNQYSFPLSALQFKHIRSSNKQHKILLLIARCTYCGLRQRKYGTLSQSIYTFHHFSVAFAEQINHRKVIYSAVCSELLPPQLSDPLKNSLSVCTSGLHISPSLLYILATNLHRLHCESTVIFFTVTKAT